MYRPPFPAPLAVTTATIAGVPRWRPRQITVETFGAGDVNSGPLWDLAALDDRIVVAADELPGDGNALCRASTVTRLHFFDPEDLRAIGTATAPPCLRRIASDPAGTGFFGVYRRDQGYALGRFDRSGRVLAERQLPGTGAEPPRVSIDLVVTEAPPMLAVVIASLGAEFEDDQLVLASPRDLSVVSTSTFGHARLRSISAAGPGRLVISDNRSDAVRWQGIDAGGAGTLANVTYTVLASAEFGPISYHAASGSAVVAVVAPDGALLTSSTREITGQTVPFQGSYVRPLGAAPWLMDPLRMVVGMLHWPRDGEPRSFAVFYRPAEGRFVPGTVAIGEGVISRMKADAQGRVWGLLPWAAGLVRLSPAR